MITIQTLAGSDINVTMLEHLLFYRSTLSCNLCQAIRIAFNKMLAVEYSRFTVAEYPTSVTLVHYFKPYNNKNHLIES